MKFGDLLNTLAAKIGVQQDPTFINLLSSSELANREVGDELAQKFNTGLMSLDGAKNNPELLNHFKPIVLGSADNKFAILATKYGYEDENAGEKSTYKKIDLLAAKLEAKIAEAEAKAQSAGGNKSEEVANLTKQIAALQQQMADQLAAKDKEINDYKTTAKNQQTDFMIGLELKGKRYANSELGDTNVEIARALLNNALKEKKAVIVNENGEIRLKQSDNPQLDYVDASFKQVSFKDFTDSVLADKHMLEVSTETKPGAPVVRTTLPTLQGGGQIDTSKVDAAAQSSLADLQ